LSEVRKAGFLERMSDDIPVADSGLSVTNLYGRAQLDQWLEDVDLMKSHATSQGLLLPARMIDKICDVAKLRVQLEPVLAARVATPPNLAERLTLLMRRVLELHSELSVLIAPATPRSLGSLGATLHRPWIERILRPSFIAGLLTLALVAIAVFAFTAADAGKGGVLAQLNWMAAAALGATFSALFTAYRYIVNRTFDPQYTAVYWVRIILGGVAGVVMANFGRSFGDTTAKLTPAVLALLGGYSAEAVNQLLTRFTEVLVAAVKGTHDAQLREKEKEIMVTKSKAREELSLQRERTVEELIAITEDAKQAKVPPELVQRLNGALARVQGASIS
jgi:hypothetical protein